jgi:hypothetical protein
MTLHSKASLSGQCGSINSHMTRSLEATVSVLFIIQLSSLHFPLALEEHLNNYIFFLYIITYKKKKTLHSMLTCDLFFFYNSAALKKELNWIITGLSLTMFVTIFR